MWGEQHVFLVSRESFYFFLNLITLLDRELIGVPGPLILSTIRWSPEREVQFWSDGIKLKNKNFSCCQLSQQNDI